MKSILSGAITLPWLLAAQPANAIGHNAKALVLSCIDFRFLEKEHSFLLGQSLENQYDLTALAGASLALESSINSPNTDAFWHQLDLSYRLHHIEKVIILDHQECGAFTQEIDSRLSQDLEREEQVHINYLNQASLAIQLRYPKLKVELYFVTLQMEVKTILARV